MLEYILPTLLSLTFQAGYLPDQQIANYQLSDDFETIENAFFTSFSLEAESKGLFLSGGMYCQILREYDKTTFIPIMLDSRFAFGYRFGPFELAYSHSCYHPISPWQKNQTFRDMLIPRYEGSFDELYFQVSIKTEVK